MLHFMFHFTPPTDELSLGDNSLIGTIPRQIGFLSSLCKSFSACYDIRYPLPIASPHSSVTFLSRRRWVVPLGQQFDWHDSNWACIAHQPPYVLRALCRKVVDSKNTWPYHLYICFFSTEELSLDGNSLTGTIPDQIGSLTALGECCNYHSIISISVWPHSSATFSFQRYCTYGTIGWLVPFRLRLNCSPAWVRSPLCATAQLFHTTIHS